MRAHRIVAQWLLLLALLAGQQVALVHAFRHLPQREAAESQAPGLPHGELCAQCLLSAHLGQALTSSVLILPSAAVVLPEAHPPCGSPIAAPLLGFHSRAPPAPL